MKKIHYKIMLVKKANPKPEWGFKLLPDHMALSLGMKPFEGSFNFTTEAEARRSAQQMKDILEA